LTASRFEHATFTESQLVGADLRGANLQHSRFRNADLTELDAANTDFRNADLQGAILHRAHFIDTDLRDARLRGTKRFETATFLRADIREVDFSGAYILRRQIHDENYLDEYKKQSRLHRVLYGLWWVTSDCGRSAARWSAVVAAMTIIFGFVFTFLPIDYGDHETPLSPYYFSLVTVTTLGYGDVLPAALSSQIVVMAEIVCGYLMLGGLLAIFADKMARRAD